MGQNFWTCLGQINMFDEGPNMLNVGAKIMYLGH
jgi:hypothetical protein